ncbi:CaiB/BaiF CoA transferase family protein [Micromonospora sp. NPDC005113]
MRPLEGVTVLELGQVIAAPYASLLLADLGADVIKVERPVTGDNARDPQVTWMRGESATFETFNRNKRSIALDLRSGDDYADFLGLVSRADVVLSNLLPRAARQLKVDPATLRGHNPRLITCMISGFGADSPESEQPSYDLIHQALTGFLMLNGTESDPPVRVGVPLADLSAGLFASYGILAALQARHATGVGDHVDISMYQCMLSLLTYQATMYLTAGIAPQRVGSAHEYVVPWQAFQSADGWIVIAARANHFWASMCRAMRLEHLIDDPRFAGNAARLENRAELVALLSAQFRTECTQSWLDRLTAAGVPAAEVRTVPQALDLELQRPDNSIRSAPHPRLGDVVTLSNPVRFGALDIADHAPAPALDEHRQSLIPSRPQKAEARDD